MTDTIQEVLQAGDEFVKRLRPFEALDAHAIQEMIDGIRQELQDESTAAMDNAEESAA